MKDKERHHNSMRELVEQRDKKLVEVERQGQYFTYFLYVFIAFLLC